MRRKTDENQKKMLKFVFSIPEACPDPNLSSGPAKPEPENHDLVLKFDTKKVCVPILGVPGKPGVFFLSLYKVKEFEEKNKLFWTGARGRGRFPEIGQQFSF